MLLAAALVGQAAAGSEEADLPRVRTAPVEAHAPLRELRFGGLVRASRRARLAFSVGGRLIEQARRGASVRRGEIVARIDPTELENAVLESDAALYSAKVHWRRERRERERIERLVSAGGRAARDLDEARAAEDSAKASVAAAESRLRLAERRLDESALRAPFAGIISEVLLEEGEHVTPGAAVVALADDSQREMYFELPESVVSRIRLGMPVRVEFPLAALPQAHSRISSVTYVAGSAGKLFPVVATLPSDVRALPGMSGEVVIQVADEPALLVPLDAIVDPTGQKPCVYRLEGERVRRTPVQVLDFVADRVAVRGPLSQGDEVVIAGHAGLLDGQRVDVALPAPAAPE
jgi:RND family efflux transporter MFP subunit